MIKMNTGQCGRLWRFRHRRLLIKDLYHLSTTVATDPLSDADEVDDIFLEVGYQRRIKDGSGYRCAGIEPWKYQCDHAKKIMGHLQTLILWRGNLYSFFLNPQ
jgi:hypothetical protein